MRSWEAPLRIRLDIRLDVHDPVARQRVLETLAGGGASWSHDGFDVVIRDSALAESVEVRAGDRTTVLEPPWRRAALLDALARVGGLQLPYIPVFADEVLAVDAALLASWVSSRRAALHQADAELAARGVDALATVRHVAHQTRGSGGAYGVHAATQLAKSLEDAVREAAHTVDVADALARVRDRLEALSALVERVRWVPVSR